MVRRTVRWTLAVLGGFVLVGIVVGIVDGTKGGKPQNADAGAPNRPKIRLAAGDVRSNPVPFGVGGGVWNGWRLRVISATPTATQFLGHRPREIQPGGQELMVSIAATYKAGGYAGLRGLLRRLYVDGSHNVFYSPDSGDLNCAAARTVSRLDRPLNELARRVVFSGRTVNGHLCFQIASNDANSAVLFVNSPRCGVSTKYDTCTKKVWFALR
jgi:hypothetical protein